MNSSEANMAKQIAALIREKRNILLVTHAKMDCDALSSTIALYLLLRKIGKNVTAICQDPVPETFKFLPDTSAMNTGFSENADFIITLDISRNPLEALRWNVEGNKVNIIVSPAKGGYFEEQDLSFQGGRGKNFDLIIACDAADIQQLGAIYDQNAELFHSVPVIVIDHHASNEGFGVINYIVPTNASTTETLYDLIPALTGQNYELVDENIATLLLAGIITDTGSFQHPNTTPKSFEVAAELIDMGARQQEIIKHLFKTKKLTTLRLWGRVLSKIKYDPVHRFVWSTVNRDDLSDEHATSDETEGLIDELLSNAPGVEVVLLLKEREDGVISGSLRTTTPLCDATAIAEMFGGGGHRQAAGFKIRKARFFEEAVSEVVTKIEEFQQKRLGIAAEPSAEKPEVTALPKGPHQDALLQKVLTSPQNLPSEFSSTALETEADFEKKTSVPAPIDSVPGKLEDRADFEAVSFPTTTKEETVEVNEEIPDWLYEKPKQEKKAPEKEEEIPEWLREKPKSAKASSGLEESFPAFEPSLKADKNSQAETASKAPAEKPTSGAVSEKKKTVEKKKPVPEKQKPQAEKAAPRQQKPAAPRKEQKPALAASALEPAPLEPSVPNLPSTASVPVQPAPLREAPSAPPVQASPPPPAPLSPEEKDLPPLSGILDPNPPADLIPQMPRTPERPSTPLPSTPPPPPNYGAWPPPFPAWPPPPGGPWAPYGGYPPMPPGPPPPPPPPPPAP